MNNELRTPDYEMSTDFEGKMAEILPQSGLVLTRYN